MRPRLPAKPGGARPKARHDVRRLPQGCGGDAGEEVARRLTRSANSERSCVASAIHTLPPPFAPNLNEDPPHPPPVSNTTHAGGPGQNVLAFFPRCWKSHDASMKKPTNR